MASGFKQTTGNRFKITFEAPWGGVASNKNPLDIQDNQFVACQGLIDIDGVLCFINTISAKKYFPTNRVSVPSNSTLCLIFVIGTLTYGVDQYGNIFLQGYTGGPPSTSQFFFRCAASDGPWSPDIADDVQVLNGLAYISVFSRNSIYTFDPTVGSGTLTLNSSYTGGKVLGVLDDYLLQMNTNSATDGIQPTRVNWSGPGLFSTWDPSANRAAGFNTLVNINDSITGFISLASVGIIIGKQGLVEASPTGIGIAPFAFTTLWTSEVGQGILYPETVSQYGQNTYAGTNSGIFKISTGGFQDVSGAARKAILELLQLGFSSTIAAQASQLAFAGAIFLYAFNSTYPTPYYVFVGVVPEALISPAPAQMQMWFLNLESGAWFNLPVDPTELINIYNTIAFSNIAPSQIKMANILPLSDGDFQNNQLPVVMLYGWGAVDATGPENFLATTYIYNGNNKDDSEFVPGNIKIITKAYEIEPWSEPTIRRIIIKAYGSGTLNLSINGVSFGSIVLDGTTSIKRYLNPGGQYTGLSPQLTITSSNFKGVIVKIIMYGTYADGEPD